jgi:stress-induced morphogen
MRTYEMTIVEMQKEIHALQLRVKALVEDKMELEKQNKAVKEINKLITDELATHLDKQIKQSNFEKDCI